MQRTMIIRGGLGRDYPNSIDAVINKLLEKNPEFRLIEVKPMTVDLTKCTVLCVFESKEDHSAGENKEDK